MFQFFKTRIRSVFMISCPVVKISWGLLINSLNEKFNFSWQTKETLSCLMCIVFPFRELSTSFCQNWHSLHCQMYMQICVTWYKPTEHTSAKLLCLDNEIWAHQRIKKSCIYFGELRKRKALYPHGPRTESKISNSFFAVWRRHLQGGYWKGVLMYLSKRPWSISVLHSGWSEYKCSNAFSLYPLKWY